MLQCQETVQDNIGPAPAPAPGSVLNGPACFNGPATGLVSF